MQHVHSAAHDVHATGASCRYKHDNSNDGSNKRSAEEMVNRMGQHILHTKVGSRQGADGSSDQDEKKMRLMQAMMDVLMFRKESRDENHAQYPKVNQHKMLQMKAKKDRYAYVCIDTGAACSITSVKQDAPWICMNTDACSTTVFNGIDTTDGKGLSPTGECPIMIHVHGYSDKQAALDKTTPTRIPLIDNQGFYVPGATARVLSATRLAERGYALNMNYLGEGEHALVGQDGYTVPLETVDGILCVRVVSLDARYVKLTPELEEQCKYEHRDDNFPPIKITKKSKSSPPNKQKMTAVRDGNEVKVTIPSSSCYGASYTLTYSKAPGNEHKEQKPISPSQKWPPVIHPPTVVNAANPKPAYWHDMISKSNVTMLNYDKAPSTPTKAKSDDESPVMKKSKPTPAADALSMGKFGKVAAAAVKQANTKAFAELEKRPVNQQGVGGYSSLTKEEKNWLWFHRFAGIDIRRLQKMSREGTYLGMEVQGKLGGVSFAAA